MVLFLLLYLWAQNITWPITEAQIFKTPNYWKRHMKYAAQSKMFHFSRTVSVHKGRKNTSVSVNLVFLTTQETCFMVQQVRETWTRTSCISKRMMVGIQNIAWTYWDTEFLLIWSTYCHSQAAQQPYDTRTLILGRKEWSPQVWNNLSHVSCGQFRQAMTESESNPKAHDINHDATLPLFTVE